MALFLHIGNHQKVSIVLGYIKRPLKSLKIPQDFRYKSLRPLLAQPTIHPREDAWDTYLAPILGDLSQSEKRFDINPHLKYYPCCPEPYPDIYFNMVIRRKPLFYIVNLIIPCVGIFYLSILVFYLPAQSKQKTGLVITLLVSQTFYLTLIIEVNNNIFHIPACTG